MIRLATLTDIAVLTKLYQALATEMHQLQPQNYQANYAPDFFEWEKMITDTNQAVYLETLQNGTIIGFSHVTTARTSPSALFVPHFFAYLTALYVQPDYRRQGLARQLLAQVEQWRQSQKLAYLELNVLANNQAATKLYQNAGFTAQNYTFRH